MIAKRTRGCAVFRFSPVRFATAVCLSPWLACASIAAADAAAPSPGRPLTLADLDRLQRVGAETLSPDGREVLYVVTRTDVAADAKRSSVWRVDWQGKSPQQLSADAVPACAPSWSPDGRWIAYVQADDEHGAQLWLRARDGSAPARRVTNVPGGIGQYVWSPDGKRLAIVHEAETAAPKDARGRPLPQPWVIDRVRFKHDAGEGYLHDGIVSPRIYLYELDSGRFEALTTGGAFEESDPAWSPDGRRIAFVSNREPGWEYSDYGDIHVVDAVPGSLPKRLTDTPGGEYGPAWSPDGSRIAFVQGSEPQYWMYNQTGLAVVSVEGGKILPLAGTLDRDIDSPAFSADGRHVRFLVDDDRQRYLAEVPVDDGKVRRLSPDGLVVASYAQAGDRTLLRAASDVRPYELLALEQGDARALTAHNAAVLDGIALARWETIDFEASDGERIGGLLARPATAVPGQHLPTVLWLHGGPYGQDTVEFDEIAQWLTAHGYAVLSVNYRGGSGRGREFGRGIFRDWGNRDVSDALAGVDHLVRTGVADPERLGVGGWSYGGFLTDFILVSDDRFKAAVSGAGSPTKTSLYGTDLYAHGNELEWGTPWDDTDTWMRVSRPLYQAGRIRTPTLFLHGQKDFNVPISGSEQLYRALKTLHVPTRLVVYPDEHHGIARPSFRRDMMERLVGWYGCYLKPGVRGEPERGLDCQAAE